MSVLASSSPQCHCPNYWTLLANLIDHTPSTRKKRWWVWLFQVSLRTSDEWHFIRSLQTWAQFILQYISLLCIHFGFSGVTHIYIAEEGLLTSQMASHDLIGLFKTCFEMITFLKWEYLSEECKWSPEPIKIKLDKVVQENTHLGIESWVLQDDVVTHCSHNPFILMK